MDDWRNPNSLKEVAKLADEFEVFYTQFARSSQVDPKQDVVDWGHSAQTKAKAGVQKFSYKHGRCESFGVQGSCNYCKAVGHWKFECVKLKRKNERACKENWPAGVVNRMGPVTTLRRSCTPLPVNMRCTHCVEGLVVSNVGVKRNVMFCEIQAQRRRL